MHKKYIPLVLNICFILLLSACGNKNVTVDVGELFSKAQIAMQEKNYRTAIDLYSQIQRDFPFSDYALEAELSLADAYYLNEDYLDAAASYKLFNELHPRTEASSYVLFQTAMSLSRVNNSVDRTVSEAEEAVSYFEQVMILYPNTNFARQAPEEIIKAKTKVAERELYLAEVFWNMGNKSAAYARYAYVLENFQDLPDIIAYTEGQARAAYLAKVEMQSEQERINQHGSWKNYFRWL